MTRQELIQLKYLAEKLRLETYEKLEEYDKMDKDGLNESSGLKSIKEYSPEYSLFIALHILEMDLNSELYPE